MRSDPYRARRDRARLAALTLCCTVAVIVGSQAFAAEQSLATVTARLGYRDKEQELLHLRADLSGVKCLAPESGQFVPHVGSEQPLTIVNLWSLHCAPCMEEFRQFRNILRYVKSKGYPIEFLFVADPPEVNLEATVRSFWSNPPVALPETFPCISENRQLRISLGFDGVPVTLLLDRNRVVRHAYIGSITGRGIAAVIERLLDILPKSNSDVPPSANHSRVPRRR